MDDAPHTNQPWLYLFIDESGNFDFGDSGTQHFVMAAISACHPGANAACLLDYKYRLLTEGINVAHCHASEDRQYVRNQVLKLLNELSGTKFHVAEVNKRALPASLRESKELHAFVSSQLVSGVLKSYELDQFAGVVVVIDQALPKRQQGIFHESLKPLLKSLKIPFQLHFQPIKFESVLAIL